MRGLHYPAHLVRPAQAALCDHALVLQTQNNRHTCAQSTVGTGPLHYRADQDDR